MDYGVEKELRQNAGGRWFSSFSEKRHDRSHKLLDDFPGKSSFHHWSSCFWFQSLSANLPFQWRQFDDIRWSCLEDVLSWSQACPMLCPPFPILTPEREHVLNDFGLQERFFHCKHLLIPPFFFFLGSKFYYPGELRILQVQTEVFENHFSLWQAESK